jgi:hypothetical protein
MAVEFLSTPEGHGRRDALDLSAGLLRAPRPAPLPLIEGGCTMRRVAIVLAAATLLLGFTTAFADEEKSALDDEGFITTWLVLAPIPLEANQSGVDGLGKEQIKDEAKLQPKEGDKVKVGENEIVWKPYQTKGHIIDFNDFLGKQTEDSVGYAVCYITADADMKDIRLKTGSDDQAKVYLNGKEVLKQEQARALDKDQDTTEVSLNKGVNVLVFKIVNEKLDWSGCARFTDKDGNPIKNIKVKRSPK